MVLYNNNLSLQSTHQSQPRPCNSQASQAKKPLSMADNENRDSKEVQYFDSDFSFEEHAAECVAQQETSAGDDGILTEDDDDLLPQSQSKFWDAFHSNHSAGNFYKPRRYLIKSFPCILDYFEHDGDDGNHGSAASAGDALEDSRIDEGGGGDKILLEIGCGSGSSCIPIIKHCPGGDDTKVKHVLLACDSSPVAVETTRRYMDKTIEKEGLDGKFSFGTFVSDPSLCEEETEVSFMEDVKSAYNSLVASNNEDDQVNGLTASEGGVVGITLMVFVLSAVTPSRVCRFLDQVYQTTKAGGKVCFRDYGVYDMPMLRFDSSAACKSTTSDDPVFVRGEGTIARFFSVETARELFEAAGFTAVELRYCTVFNNNRKTGQKLKRVFVHGVFEKPR